MIQRELEASGLTTINISVMRGLTLMVNPPRTAFNRFPLGRVTGKAHDTETQLEVVKASLHALEEINTPGGFVKLPFKWEK